MPSVQERPGHSGRCGSVRHRHGPASKAAPPPAPAAARRSDDLAAAAFTEEPATNGKQAEAPATIDFICEFCEAKIQAPLAEAGKRMQCPNPECRRIVKVPTPKEEKPKDWRELAKKGPTVAQMMQQEKIDDAAWGTQTDKVRAGSAALTEAGALPAPKAAPIGVRGWMRRVMLDGRNGDRPRGRRARRQPSARASAATRALPATCCVTWSRARGAPEELVKDPVVRAEGYRAIGEYKIPARQPVQGHRPAQTSRSRASSQPAGKTRPIEYDLFLIDLALTMMRAGRHRRRGDRATRNTTGRAANCPSCC